jgi:hypothetical protein
MASDDSTRTDFDLSPWRGQDPLSIFQAAWLWAGIPPTLPETQENELRYSVPLASARGLFGRLEKAAKAGKPPILGDAPTKQKLISRAVWGNKYLGNQSRPAVYQTVPADDWRDALVALADLRAFVESTGQRPAFFFLDVAAEASGQSLNERVKERAQQIADGFFEGGENQVSMTAVAKKLTAEAETKRSEKSDDALYIGQKGPHTLSWYKTELKGWQPEKIDRPRKK